MSEVLAQLEKKGGGSSGFLGGDNDIVINEKSGSTNPFAPTITNDNVVCIANVKKYSTFKCTDRSLARIWGVKSDNSSTLLGSNVAANVTVNVSNYDYVFCYRGGLSNITMTIVRA